MTSSPSDSGPEPDVQELLRRWYEQRDQQALDELLARNLDFLQRYARGRLAPHLRSKEDTGDVVQDAVLEFMRYGPPFVVDSEARLRGLLLKIVDGVLAGHHRFFARMRRQVARENPLPDGTSVVLRPLAARDPTPSAIARGAEREAAVRLAIATLDPLDQRIVLLRVYGEQPFAQVAVEVGMKEDSVRVRCNRALEKVSKKLLAMRRGDVDEFLA